MSNIQDELISFLQKENLCIIFDTNIYLNLYEYSPEATEFFVELANLVNDKIILPSTVKREFEKNQPMSYKRQKNKFKNAISNLLNPLNQVKDKLGKQFDILESFKYPNIKVLKEDTQTILSNLQNIFDEYINNHSEFESVYNVFLEEDIVRNLIQEIINNKNLLDDFTIDEIYLLCAEGEKRFKDEIPPGFKDDKTKKGVQAYGDFLIWKEALNYCSKNQLDLIFVTDDEKPDWYTIEKSQRKGFREELLTEFAKVTKQSVVGVTSKEFFSAVATFYNKSIPSTVEWLLGYDIESYFEELSNSNLKYEISDILCNSDVEFVDTSTLSNYDGSYFEISEDEEITVDFKNVEFNGYYDGAALYTLTIGVNLHAISSSYWGRDDDTKEIILSPADYYTLEGTLKVDITRYIESYLDYWDNSNTYDEFEIVDGLLYAIDSYNDDDLCVECGQNLGIYQNYNNELICENCITDITNGTICTTCGRKVPYEYMYDEKECKDCVYSND